MSKPLTIGLIGFGNIGAGVLRTLAENEKWIAARTPRPLRIKTIADLDVTTKRDAPYDPDQLTTDAATIMAAVWRTLTVNADRFATEMTGGFILATELADLLVTRGVAFREAHEAVGQLVAWCESEGRRLDSLTAEELQRFHPEFPELWNTDYTFKWIPQDKEKVSFLSLLKTNPPSLEFNTKIWVWFIEQVNAFHASLDKIRVILYTKYGIDIPIKGRRPK